MNEQQYLEALEKIYILASENMDKNPDIMLNIRKIASEAAFGGDNE